MRLLTHLFSMISLVRKKAALWCEDAGMFIYHLAEPKQYDGKMQLHGLVGARTTVTRQTKEGAAVHRVIDGLTAFYALPDDDRTVKLRQHRWMFDETDLTQHYRKEFASDGMEKVVGHVKGRRWDAARAHDTAIQIAPARLKTRQKVQALTSIVIDNGPSFPGLMMPNAEHLYFPSDPLEGFTLSPSEIGKVAKSALLYKRGGKVDSL